MLSYVIRRPAPGFPLSYDQFVSPATDLLTHAIYLTDLPKPADYRESVPTGSATSQTILNRPIALGLALES